jgi:hypothetical protein
VLVKPAPDVTTEEGLRSTVLCGRNEAQAAGEAGGGRKASIARRRWPAKRRKAAGEGRDRAEVCDTQGARWGNILGVAG